MLDKSVARAWLEADVAESRGGARCKVTLAISFTIGHTSVRGGMGTLPDFLASPVFDEALVESQARAVWEIGSGQKHNSS